MSDGIVIMPHRAGPILSYPDKDVAGTACDRQHSHSAALFEARQRRMTAADWDSGGADLWVEVRRVWLGGFCQPSR